MTVTALTRPRIRRGLGLASSPVARIVRTPRWTQRPGETRYVTLEFDAHGRLLPGAARTWARSVARNLWGEITDEHRLRTAALPGPAWWFSCSGHGGYVLVAPPQAVAPFFRRFAEDGSPVWSDADRWPSVGVYAFEEDCNWAVFLATYPAAIIAEQRYEAHRFQGRVHTNFSAVANCLRHWHDPEIADVLLLRPALPSGTPLGHPR